MRVIAIDDTNRPNVIPLSKWIKKGEIYTVLKAIKCNVQGGLLGFELAEIDLSACAPYLYFAATRFSTPVETPENEEVEQILEIA